jgi:hypothetical protein
MEVVELGGEGGGLSPEVANASLAESALAASTRK